MILMKLALGSICTTIVELLALYRVFGTSAFRFVSRPKHQNVFGANLD